MTLIKELKALSGSAYAPYSNFKVAAIVVMTGGETFSGVNVENASFGLTVCAERNAIAMAIANGFKKYDFAEIHLYGGDGSKNIMPCGACRQVLIEVFGPSKVIYSYSNDNIKKFTIGELIPEAFTDGDI